MDTFTREQIKATLIHVQHYGTLDDNVDYICEKFGLEVQPAKPEPGTWHLTRTEGWWAHVDTGGDLLVIQPSGETDFYAEGVSDWPDLDPATPPARVVPAEPVELSEADLIRAYPDGVPYAYGGFINFPAADRSALLRMCQTLVAEHGIGRVEVTREQVQALLTDWYRSDRSEPLSEAVNAVMELLKASK